MADVKWEEQPSSRRRPRILWPIILGTLAAVIALLLAGVFACWQNANSVPPFTPTLPPLPRPNGYDSAAAVAARLVQVEHRVPSQPGREDRAHLRARMVQLRPLLDQIRAAFRLEWRVPPALSTADLLKQRTYEFRACDRGFLTESRLSQAEGDPDTALQRCLDAAELGSRLERGAGLWSPIVSQSEHMGWVRRAEHLLPELSVSAIPAALERVLRIRSLRPPCSERWESQRIQMLALQTEGHRAWISQPFLDQLHTLNALRRTYGTVHLIEFALASKRADLADLDTYYRRMAAESRKPVRQRESVPLPRAWWWQENARILGGDQAWEWEVSATDFALLEVALAVRLHRLEHGSYPARLSEISPRWLPSVPLDTWDQPIVYRLKHGRPVIYSLGPDGKDDGGTPVSQLILHPETHGDLVFGALAPRQPPRAAGRR